jgi:hypothetical protein
MASRSGAGIHIAHVSDADSVQMIHDARMAGKRITAETCTHYLSFAAEEIEDGNTLYKCAPPIREGENIDRLWKVRVRRPRTRKRELSSEVFFSSLRESRSRERAREGTGAAG